MVSSLLTHLIVYNMHGEVLIQIVGRDADDFSTQFCEGVQVVVAVAAIVVVHDE